MDSLVSLLHGWAAPSGRPLTPTRIYFLHSGGLPALSIIGIAVAALVIVVTLAVLGSWGRGRTRS